ncbi:hypothetical protein [Gynuella sp.]|uniref:hypothetical protein n=1 Tax=Gynuella sp. TaxID=2969146 RepID=UPI003D0B6058
MNIKLGEGVGPVQFGVTKAKTIELLGAPDKVYETDSDCERLQFNDIMLELSFEPENENLLGWIEVHNSNAELFGLKLLGKTKEDVLMLLAGHLNYAPETEDYGSMESLSYDNHWLELQFEFNRLKCINFGVLYDESDAPIWPAQNQPKQ